MKKKYYLIIIICVLVITIGVFLVKELSYKQINDIQEFNYHYYGGWDTRNNVYYEINCMDNKCKGNYKTEDGDKRDITISEETKNKLVKIINKYHVNKWDGFNKKVDWTDQASFGLEITNEKDETIKAEGYGRFPSRHNEFRDEVKELLDYSYSLDLSSNTIDYIKKFEYKEHSINTNIRENYFYIDSQSELDAFNKLFNYELDVNDVKFGKEVILVNYIRTGSGSNKFKLNDIYVKYDRVMFDIDRYIPEVGTDDMAYWFVGAVVNEKDIEDYDLTMWKRPSSIK